MKRSSREKGVCPKRVCGSEPGGKDKQQVRERKGRGGRRNNAEVKADAQGLRKATTISM